MRYKTAIILIIAGILIIISAPAYSQPSNVERGIGEVDRPVREEVEKKMEQAPRKAPKIKEEDVEVVKGPAFFVKKITILGCESFPTEDFRFIIEKYEGRQASVGELRELAKDIEQEYLRRGVIAACFVSPQEVKEGEVVLEVVEARMGVLEISDFKYYNKKKVASYWDIEPGEILRYYKISRSLQIMNKNPDREAKAMLHAGSKPGLTDVTLNVTSRLPIHATGSIDREGSVSTGRERYSYGGKHNNFLGLDDTVLAGYTRTDHSNNVYAYHSIPITTEGTSLLYGFSQAAAFPKKDFEMYDLRSYSKSLSAFVHQDVFQKDEYMGEVYIGVDGKNKNVYTNNGVLNKDRLRILTIGARMLLRMPSSVTYIKPEFSQGLNILGALRKNEFSSRNAENTFSRFKFGIQHRRSIPPYSQLVVKVDSQFASEKLTPQEEYPLGGMNSVRGYPYADYYADNAVQTNVELLVSAAFLPKELKLPFDQKPLRDEITGLIFFDHGFGTKRGDIQGDRVEYKLASVGTGVRLNLYDQVVLRFEWGFIIPMGNPSLSESGSSRFHFSIDLEEKILQYHKEKKK
ncbi:MAG: ShlB/FhaC/HecB family hemolysin secretion/activation protein [Candidatus Omnitrophota bacterium]